MEREQLMSDMKGKVKWFSAEKGYGFIHDEGGVDRFVHVQAINGADLPANGAQVEFDPDEGKRGPRAINVTITDQGEAKAKIGRVECQSCHKLMVPRIIVGYPAFRNHPIPKRSVCPFCGELHKHLRTETWDNNSWIVGAWVTGVLALILFFAASM